MKIELVKKEEYSLMLRCANEWFSYNKVRSFDFLKIHPKLYQKDADFFLYTYFVKTNENDLVGLFSAYPIIYHDVKMLSIGTVCVNPVFRNQGILKLIFEYIDEYLSDKTDILFLLGERVRYERYGYYKTGLRKRYHLLTKNLISKNEVRLKLATEKENNILYQIYKNSTHKIKRMQSCFYDALISRDSEVFIIYHQNVAAGYLLYNNEKRTIYEIICQDDIFLESIKEISAIKKHDFSIPIEMDYEEKQQEIIARVYDSVEIVSIANLKINDFVNVLNKLYINKKPIINGTIILSVDDDNYEFLVDTKITVKKTIHKGLILSRQEFYDLLFSDFSIRIKNKNPLLTTLFPIILPGSLATVDKI